ncbi:putative membrane protein [Salmonella phage P46FS4]|uniref:Putative membrane protein n=1 Tax=Salmonella phage P46FS4 TaxID=2712940 RepID=A0A6G6XTT7_9CAUD|nr:membrane protein [Salmonella phage P46FS4]QIG62200.1 putative membrane protein [Salmonella phage P46FS4]
MMDSIKMILTFVGAFGIVATIINTEMLDEKFHEWRKERKRRRELDRLPHTDLIVHNARKRRK